MNARLTLLAILALPLLAAAAPSLAPQSDYSVHLPVILRPAIHIGGFVTEGGAPAPAAAIQVRRLTQAGSVLVASTPTDSLGRYNVIVPALAAGQLYWIMFAGSSPSRLLWWSVQPYLDPSLLGPDIDVPTFDIAGITQLAPAFNAVVSRPYNFQWSVRPAAPQDSYTVKFSGSAGFNSGPLGYVNSYQLNSLPPGAPYGNTIGYYWLVAVSWPDGSSGVQYADSRVYFTNPGLLDWLAPAPAPRPSD
jgi:hypothetical protein